MNLKLTKNAVRYAALLILETKKVVTTLEVKTLLRAHDFNAAQQDVAEYMAELSIELPLTYVAVKGYREYSLPSPQILAAPTISTDAVTKSYMLDSNSKSNFSTFNVADTKTINVPTPPTPSVNRSVISALSQNPLVDSKDQAKNAAQALKDSNKSITQILSDAQASVGLSKLGSVIPPTNVAFSNLDKNTNAQIKLDTPLAFTKGILPSWSLRRHIKDFKSQEFIGHVLNPNYKIKNRIDHVDDSCWVASSTQCPTVIIFAGNFDRTDVRTVYSKITDTDFVNARTVRFKRFNPAK